MGDIIHLDPNRMQQQKAKKKARPLSQEDAKSRSIKIPEEWHRALRFVAAEEDTPIVELVVDALRKAGIKERADKAKH